MTLPYAPAAATPTAAAASSYEHRGRFPVTSNHGPFVLGILNGTASDTLLSTKRARAGATDNKHRLELQTLHQCLVCVRLRVKISSSLASVATETVFSCRESQNSSDDATFVVVARL